MSLQHTYEAAYLRAGLNLVDVYETPGSAEVLYDLLKERDDSVNISHKMLPAYCDHLKFIASKPYEKWWLIRSGETAFGACYLTRQNEIGVFLFKQAQGMGLGRAAIEAIMQKCGKRRYLANINPSNKRSAGLFESLGFKLIQLTYEAAA